MKRKVLSTLTVFSLVITMMFSVIAACKPAKASRWGGDEMDDWPLTITCDPDFPIIGPDQPGDTREESIGGLQYEKGNRTVAFSVKNYSPDIVKIVKKKKKGPFPTFWVKGLKKGYAHIKVTIKIKYAQAGKTKYSWNIKKYPVGHNED